MKKQIFIYSTLALAAFLTAYGFISDSNAQVVSAKGNSTDYSSSCNAVAAFVAPDFVAMKTEFFYDMGPRFRPMKKSYLNKAASVSEFLEPQELERFNTFKKISVIKIKPDYSTERRVDVLGTEFSEDQLEFIRSLEYSDSFYIKAYYEGHSNVTGLEENDYFSPHFTVAPEKSAKYSEGMAALLDHFRVNNAELTKSLDQNKLMPAKLFLTVNGSGEVENVYLKHSCGFDQIDERMIKLAKNLPGKWEAAENESGEKVDQELVISYGLVGC
jgi:hypothetical protein